MAAADVLQPLPAGPVETSIGYLHPGTKEGVTWKVGTIGQMRAVNDMYRPKIEIQDLRNCDFKPTLDQNGFQFVEGATPVDPALADGDEQAKEQMYKDTIELMKKQTGASYVHIFSHIYRKDSYQRVLDIPKDANPEERSPYQSTAQFSHIDQSYHGAELTMENRIKGATPELAAEFQKRRHNRWAIVNAWRPVGRPINREPLACADGRSVADADLRPSTMDSSVYVPNGPMSELWHAVHQPGHRWYWASNMTPSEALLIKCFDTRMDGGETCRRALHSAFQHPQDHGDGRKSCELRCMLFWDDEPQTEEERARAYEN